jgi:hypothetical protein
MNIISDQLLKEVQTTADANLHTFSRGSARTTEFNSKELKATAYVLGANQQYTFYSETGDEQVIAGPGSILFVNSERGYNRIDNLYRLVNGRKMAYEITGW